jgi:ABC-type antimicrobial peptide transport system permease subunit
VEIGVYKAIGWSNIRLLWQLFLENLILVTFGFLVSLMLIYGSKSVGPLMQVKLSANTPSLSSLYLAEKAPVKTVAVGFKVYFNWLLLRNIFAVAFVSITIASLTLGLRLGLIKPRVALSRLD